MPPPLGGPPARWRRLWPEAPAAPAAALKAAALTVHATRPCWCGTRSCRLRCRPPGLWTLDPPWTPPTPPADRACTPACPPRPDSCGDWPPPAARQPSGCWLIPQPAPLQPTHPPPSSPPPPPKRPGCIYEYNCKCCCRPGSHPLLKARPRLWGLLPALMQYWPTDGSLICNCHGYGVYLIATAVQHSLQYLVCFDAT